LSSFCGDEPVALRPQPARDQEVAKLELGGREVAKKAKKKVAKKPAKKVAKKAKKKVAKKKK
jgi:hypothetical protein